MLKSPFVVNETLMSIKETQSFQLLFGRRTSSTPWWENNRNSFLQMGIYKLHGKA